MALEVRRLEPDQLSDIYKLRYEIFFEELGALLSEDEIRRGYLSDPSDNVGYHYGLYDGHMIVGSLRVVDLARLSESEELEKRFSLAPLLAKFGRESVCFVGRLALASSCRSGLALARLVLKAYEDGRRRGLKVAISDCSPYLLPLYAKLGYRCFGEAFTDPTYGLKLPIILFLEERARLKLIKSPFAKPAACFVSDDSVADWFSHSYPEYRFTFGNLIYSEANLLDLTAGLLCSDHLQRYSLFYGFADDEIAGLLNDAIFLEVKPENYLVRKGLREKHLYFILEGTVESRHERAGKVVRYGKGDVLGGDGLLVDCRRATDFATKTPVKCLLINGETIQRLEKCQPRAYAKLMRNIGRSLALKLEIASLES